ncbi:hypothetical protein H4219_000807 [Mycoemilia scoparia]|uniref:Wings apart-like protein C-terminal domain-containing protein n=1 Tax=Mycoemilia scoparia TaxID=417184 RepID=A0A9W8A671_9FUNG|nr:hypothetical protein H4219_000807 [Mycoemilia scoparia]
MDRLFPTSRQRKVPVKATYAKRGVRAFNNANPITKNVQNTVLSGSESSSDDDNSTASSSGLDSERHARDRGPKALVQNMTSTVPGSTGWVKRDTHTTIERLEKLYAEMHMASPKKHSHAAKESNKARRLGLDTMSEWDISSQSSGSEDEDKTIKVTHSRNVKPIRSIVNKARLKRMSICNSTSGVARYTAQSTSTQSRAAKITAKARTYSSGYHKQSSKQICKKSHSSSAQLSPIGVKSMSDKPYSPKRLKRDIGVVTHKDQSVDKCSPLQPMYSSPDQKDPSSAEMQPAYTLTPKRDLEAQSPPISVWKPRLGQRSGSNNIAYTYNKPMQEQQSFAGEFDLINDCGSLVEGHKFVNQLLASQSPIIQRRMNLITHNGNPMLAVSDVSDDSPSEADEIDNSASSHVEFFDIIEGILGNLRPTLSTQVRGESYLDLASRIVDPQFLKFLRAKNYVLKIYNTVRRESDKLHRAASIFIIGMLLCEPNTAFTLSVELQALENIPRWLFWKSDPFILKNNSTATTEFIERLSNCVRKSGIIPTSVQVTSRNIAIYVLSFVGVMINDQIPEGSDLVRAEFCKSGCLSFITEEIFVRQIPTLLKYTSNTSTSLFACIDDSLGPDSQKQLETLEIVEAGLSVVEFSTFLKTDNQAEVLEEDCVLPALLTLLALHQQSEREFDTNIKIKKEVLESLSLLLRLIINLCNNNKECCEGIVDRMGLDIICRNIVFGCLEESNQESGDLNDVLKQLQFDTLLFTITLLSSIVEMDPKNSDAMREIELSPECSRTSSCYPKCACYPRVPVFSLLARAFSHVATSHSFVQSNGHALKTHLALLMGSLMRDNKESHKKIMGLLSKSSINCLVEVLENFTNLGAAAGGSERGRKGGNRGTSKSHRQDKEPRWHDQNTFNSLITPRVRRIGYYSANETTASPISSPARRILSEKAENSTSTLQSVLSSFRRGGGPL